MKQGFGLVEFLVTLVVIGVISVLALNVIDNKIKKEKRTKKDFSAYSKLVEKIIEEKMKENTFFPDYNNCINLLPVFVKANGTFNNSASYTPAKNGWLFYHPGNEYNDGHYIYINNKLVGRHGEHCASCSIPSTIIIPVSEGEVITQKHTNPGSWSSGSVSGFLPEMLFCPVK